MVDLRSQLCVDGLHFWVCARAQALGLYNHLSVLCLAALLDHLFSAHLSSGGARAALDRVPPDAQEGHERERQRDACAKREEHPDRDEECAAVGEGAPFLGS